MPENTNRRYKFNWELLGDLEVGRPNLGHQMRVEVYRLMQFSFRDIIEARYGSDEADRIFYEAGFLAGKEFYDNLIGQQEDLNSFVKKLQTVLKDMGVGILRVEEADIDKGHLTMTVSEDLDCSGLPDTGNELCTYDEGFIAALLNSYTGKSFTVKEVDCWCTGDRTCRFTADTDGA
ncbi:MAG: 4-vinyl reductase [Nitrospirae bacterium]|nr:4-vinyl reductase [Nitrospirota bacterium]